MVEHFYWFYWFVPRKNMTEGAFAKSLRHVSELPHTIVPIYEPRYPDAPLLSSVSLPYIAIGFADAMISASTMPHDRPWGPGVPDHLEFISIFWEGFAISDLEREQLLKVVAMVAEGMGAVYGALVEQVEDVGGEVFVFTDLISEGYSVLFLENELVELAGREVIDGLGRTLWVSNGVALLQEVPYEELNPIIRDLFTRAEILKGEPLQKIHERPVYVQEVQRVQRVLPQGRPYWDV